MISLIFSHIGMFVLGGFFGALCMGLCAANGHNCYDEDYWGECDEEVLCEEYDTEE